jgi:SSS family solute:Na+ symporter
MAINAATVVLVSLATPLPGRHAVSLGVALERAASEQSTV